MFTTPSSADAWTMEKKPDEKKNGQQEGVGGRSRSMGVEDRDELALRGLGHLSVGASFPFQGHGVSILPTLLVEALVDLRGVLGVLLADARRAPVAHAPARTALLNSAHVDAAGVVDEADPVPRKAMGCNQGRILMKVKILAMGAREGAPKVLKNRARNL
jgi:hypothetical protein